LRHPFTTASGTSEKLQVVQKGFDLFFSIEHNSSGKKAALLQKNSNNPLKPIHINNSIMANPN
jgi:hypothetical protein